MSTLKTHNLQSPDAGSVNIAMTPNAGMVVTGISTFTGAIDANGDLDVDGHANLDNVSISGITTFNSRAFLADDLTITGTAPRINFVDTDHNSDFRIDVDGGLFQIDDTSNGNAARFTITSAGDILIGTQTSAGKLTVDSGASNTCATFKSTDVGAGINLVDSNARSSIEQNGTTLKISSDTGAEFANSDIRLQVDGATQVLIDDEARMMIGTTTVGEASADDLTLSTSGHTGITIRSGSSNYGNLFFTDVSSGDQFQGFVQYLHSNNTLQLGTNKLARLFIKSSGFVGIGEDEPQTELNVIGTISTGRNVARELGTIINISSNHSGSRAGGNVINGQKNYEAGGGDWLAQGSNHVNANLTIDLGTAISCDRFVIYNQNEYQNSRREVKRFTLEGSNDNSSWTTVLDDNCGASNGHEPNPGWSFRIPSSLYDDDEGLSYRYWRFTMKSFQSNNDGYGGVMELELYAASDNTDGEITTSSLSAGTVNAQIVQTVGQPSFHARLINHKNATQNPLIYDDVLVNVGNHYHSTGSDAGKFVVPVRGTYFFFWEAIKNGSSGVSRLYLQKNASRTYSNMHLRLQEEGNYANGCMNVIMQLEPNDRIHIELAVGGVHASEYTHFGGYLIG